MNWIKKTYSTAIYWLCRIIPKRNTAVVFTWPAFEETARALVPRLAQTAVDKIYYLAAADIVGGQQPADWDAPKVVVFPKRSLKALWAFLRSRYIFTTHQCYTPCFPDTVTTVNVWHGMPIKKLGWLRGQPMRARYEVATSSFWQPILQACMRPWGRVLINELPRNERLLTPSKDVRNRLLGTEKADCKKIVVWLPTYRRAVRGGLDHDGLDFQNVVQLPDFDEARFAQWLKKNEMICIIKPHPLGPLPEIKTSGHLRIVDDRALASAGLTLYALLAEADALLTDVSSVYIDYLLLNRPVVHAFADRDEYAGDRGFNFDWTDEYLAGHMVTDMDGVYTALSDVAAGRDDYAERRAKLKALFHQESPLPASVHLLEQIGLPVQVDS